MQFTWRASLASVLLVGVTIAAPQQQSGATRGAAVGSGSIPVSGPTSTSTRAPATSDHQPAEANRTSRVLKFFSDVPGRLLAGWTPKPSTRRTDQLAALRQEDPEINATARYGEGIQLASPRDYSQDVSHQVLSVPVSVPLPVPQQSYRHAPSCATTNDVHLSTANVLSALGIKLADQRSALLQALTSKCGGGGRSGTTTCDVHPLLEGQADIAAAIDWLKSGQDVLKTSLSQAKSALTSGQATIGQGISSLRTGQEDLKNAVSQTKSMVTDGQSVIITDLADLSTELGRAQKTILHGQAEILHGVNWLETGFGAIKEEIVHGNAGLQSGQSDIVADIKDVMKSLETAKDMVVDGQSAISHDLSGLETKQGVILKTVKNTKDLVVVSQETMKEILKNLNDRRDVILQAVGGAKSMILDGQKEISLAIGSLSGDYSDILKAVAAIKDVLGGSLDYITTAISNVKGDQSDLLNAVKIIKRIIIDWKESIGHQLTSLKDGQHELKRLLGQIKEKISHGHGGNCQQTDISGLESGQRDILEEIQKTKGMITNEQREIRSDILQLKKDNRDILEKLSETKYHLVGDINQLNRKLATIKDKVDELEKCCRAPTCAHGGMYHRRDDKCYLLKGERNKANFNDARTKCKLFDGGDLAIMTKKNQDKIYKLIEKASEDDAWIGVKKTGGKWKDINKNSLTFEDWKDGSAPTGDGGKCVRAKSSSNGKFWTRKNCSADKQYVCQYDPEH